MSIALDIGHSHARSLRRQRYRLIGRSCRSAYVALDNTDAHRQALQRLRVAVLEADGQLIVAGDAAEDVAELFRMSATPLLSGDPLLRSAAAARRIVNDLFEMLLPPASVPGEVCGFTAGALEDDHAGGWNAEQGLLADVIGSRGYLPLAMGSGAAVAIAELGRHGLTGIGVSLGAVRCEAAIVRHGVELARAVIPCGGEWIDEQLSHDEAGNLCSQTGVRSARLWKESNAGSLLAPVTPRERLLAAAYRKLTRDVIEAVHEACAAVPRAFAGLEPVRIVLAGGTASRPGFRELVLAALRANPLPIEIERVQVAGAWEYSVARGCLIRAALEEQTLRRRAA